MMGGVTPLFGWGVYQPLGWYMLVVSAAVYLGAFVGCVLLVRRAAIRVGNPRAGLVVGLLALCPMVVWCWSSLNLQLSSAHYQSDTHLAALAVVAGTVLTVGAVAGWIELYSRLRPRTEP